MNSQVPEEESSQRIGSYLLGKTIGAGTFGIVKAGIHLPTSEPVAIKIIVKSKISEVADVERVAREMHILRIVRHPSILQLYEIIETPAYLFLVSQYVENGELFEFVLNQGYLEEPQACSLFQQLIAGIKYLRELRVSHRDLKLENLLLDRNNRLKIIDFGLSNTYNMHQQLKTACGSPCYAAPEMIVGQSYDGSKVDVWSCGIILFAMVCGYLPFEDPDTHELYKKIKKGDLYLPANISEEFKDLISRIIEVDPSKRYTIEQIQLHPWFRTTDKPLPTLGIKVGSQLIKADPAVMHELKKMGFDTLHAKNCIEVNRQGPDLTAYYLQMKKMNKQGYESEYDLNSSNFKYDVFQENFEESFDNTRKSYYFGVHELSHGKVKGKSGSKGKPSPSKSQAEAKRKKKVMLINYTEPKPPLASSKGQKRPCKSKLDFYHSAKGNKRRQIKSFDIDSPVKKNGYSTFYKQKQLSGSKRHKSGLQRDRRNKSCSLMEHFH